MFATAGLALSNAAWSAKVSYPRVIPRKLVFPRDHGAHPEFRVEWWYVTGWLDEPYGFQITFFRARPEEESDNPSSFNPKQILFAHAALSDPKRPAGPAGAGFAREVGFAGAPIAGNDANYGGLPLLQVCNGDDHICNADTGWGGYLWGGAHGRYDFDVNHYSDNANGVIFH